MVKKHFVCKALQHCLQRLTVNAVLQLGWVDGSEVVLKANKMMASDCSEAKSWKSSKKKNDRLLALTVCWSLAVSTDVQWLK